MAARAIRDRQGARGRQGLRVPWVPLACQEHKGHPVLRELGLSARQELGSLGRLDPLAPPGQPAFVGQPGSWMAVVIRDPPVSLVRRVRPARKVRRELRVRRDQRERQGCQGPQEPSERQD